MRFFLFIAILYTNLLYPQVKMQDYTIIKDQTKIPILTPTLKNRKTVKLQLSNGLKVYLISDPDCDKSGAALSVEKGSWDEPSEYPGMAHFLEHMLFLGSKKYPKESDFSSFITTHGGMTNAFTADDHTAYMFSLNHDSIEEGLERFADFFIAPLFNSSGVAREMKAVDQEFAKNIEDDHWRQWQIIKEIGNQEHPHARFSIGNSETLSKIPLDKLKNWYKENYSANLMHLVVYSNMPIEKLKEHVAKNFTNIPNINAAQSDTSQKIMTEKNKGSMVHIEPIKKTRKLTLFWELPAKFAHTRAMENKPESFIGHILGDEGQNSLLADLKDKKLADSLSAGGYPLGPNNFLFGIDIKLTEDGLKKKDLVIEKCFQAINNLKDNIAKYIFDEIKHIATSNYQYQSRDDVFWTVMSHIQKIRKEDLATYPEKTYIPQKFDTELIQEFVDELTPQNCLFIMTADPKETKVKLTESEKWIGGKYKLESIPKKDLSRWDKASPTKEIDLPSKNKFVATKLTLLNEEAEKTDKLPVPKLIADTKHGKIYYAEDKRYLVPESYWSFHIKSSAVDESASARVLMELYVKSISEKLKPVSYPASIANLNYSLKPTDFGFEIKIEGYSEKSDNLFLEILKALKEVKPTKEQFDVYKESLLQKYKNIHKEPPFRQAMQWTFKVISKNFIAEEEKIAAIEKIDYKAFLDFTKEIYTENYVEGILHGNLTKKEATKAWDELKETLGKPIKKQRKKEIVHFPKEKFPCYAEIETKRQGNAIVLIIQGDSFSFKKRSVQHILATALKEPFHTELRTKQQTGYLTDSWAQEIERQLFNFFIVQSNSHETRDLLSRFELFLESFLQEMGKPNSEFKKEDFETIRQAIVAEMKQPPQNLQEMGSMLKLLAFDYDSDFEWRDKRIKALEKLSYEEFLPLAEQFIGKENKKRLAIMMSGTVENSLKYSPSSIDTICQESKYQSRE